MSRDSAALKPLVPAPASSPTPLLTFQVKCSGPLPGRHAALSRLAHREAAERRVRIIAFIDRKAFVPRLVQAHDGYHAIRASHHLHARLDIELAHDAVALRNPLVEVVSHRAFLLS
jgi:hypothetical protein